MPSLQRREAKESRGILTQPSGQINGIIFQKNKVIRSGKILPKKIRKKKNLE